MREIKYKTVLKREHIERDVLAIDFLNLKVLVSISGSHEWHKYKHLLEFTGIQDKNGVEIYEGDIVSSGAGRIKRVIFHQSEHKTSFSLVSSTGSITDIGSNAAEYLEVIGNVHEHKHLIENKDD